MSTSTQTRESKVQREEVVEENILKKIDEVARKLDEIISKEDYRELRNSVEKLVKLREKLRSLLNILSGEMLVKISIGPSVSVAVPDWGFKILVDKDTSLSKLHSELCEEIYRNSNRILNEVLTSISDVLDNVLKKLNVVREIERYREEVRELREEVEDLEEEFEL